jgi:predicted transcriptional regulator
MRDLSLSCRAVLDQLKTQPQTSTSLREATGYSEQGLRLAVGRLLDLGLIQRELVQRPRGQRGAPVYRYSLAAKLGAANLASQPTSKAI